MSNQNNYIITTTVGAAALSQFVCVKTPAAAVVTTAITETAWGIAQDSAAIGGTVGVQVGGVSKAVVDGSGTAIALGDLLSPGANGKLVKHDGGVGTKYFAEALGASSADGDIIEVLIFDNKGLAS